MDSNDEDNVACLGARYQAVPVETLISSYSTAENLISKRLVTIALGCLVRSASVQTVLDTITSNSATFSTKDTRDILVGLASSVENSAAMVTYLTSEAENLQDAIGSAYLADVVKALGKFKVDITQLQSLTDNDVDLDAYVKESVVASIARANCSFDWWNTYGQSLLSVLPQLPEVQTSKGSSVVTTAATAKVDSTTTSYIPSPTSSNTTSTPSSATSLEELQALPFILAIISSTFFGTASLLGPF